VPATIEEALMAQADSLAGKAALLTGSTRNLGLAIAGQLAAAGAGIMLNYHHPARKAEADQAAAATAAAHGTTVLAHEADVTTPAGVASLFDATASAFGRVDIVVNNAGVVVKKPIVQTTDDDYDRAFAVNAKAAFLMMREAARRIEDGGRVINIITSIVAFTIPACAQP
jgi:NAD(P)-dependent dehydrogenase (short-subunit alcohol dehydrogenase family)